jgi:glutaredoxin-related protein
VCGESSPQEELKRRTDEVKRCKKNLKRHLKFRDSLTEISGDYSYGRAETYTLIGANTITIDTAKTSVDYAKENLKAFKKRKKK